MKVYVDSSVVLRHLLSGDTLLSSIPPTDMVGSSDLLTIECRRVLQRERMEAHISDQEYVDCMQVLDELVDGLYLIEFGAAVKRRAAGSFPTVIGTLDAIHLSSALLWKEIDSDPEFRILTYDRQLSVCSRALGMKVGE